MIVFDTETTGLLTPGAPLDEQPYIVEVGAIRLDVSYRETDSMAFLVKPPHSIDEKALSKIHGITNAMLADAEPFIASLETLRDFFLGQRIVVGHNVAFDVAMLVNELTRVNAQWAFPYPPVQICTAEYSAQKFGKRLNLADTYKRAFGRGPKSSHRALDDCRSVASIVRKWRVG